jgi:hypothetical protein
MLVLPDFELLKRQPHPPHVARTVVEREWPNEHGTLITYQVKQGRNGRDWWIHASREGMRMSNTLHTAKPEKAAEWIDAVKIGAVRVKRLNEGKSEAQLQREYEELLTVLREKKEKRRG